jgi:hypothetical protein
VWFPVHRRAPTTSRPRHSTGCSGHVGQAQAGCSFPSLRAARAPSYRAVDSFTSEPGPAAGDREPDPLPLHARNGILLATCLVLALALAAGCPGSVRPARTVGHQTTVQGLRFLVHVGVRRGQKSPASSSPVGHSLLRGTRRGGDVSFTRALTIICTSALGQDGVVWLLAES